MNNQPFFCDKGFFMEHTIKAIIGLGNPGSRYTFTRHNIGFRVIDALAEKFGVPWKEEKNMAISSITVAEAKIVLCKPLTYMNSSGDVAPALNKKGIKSENILVIHDELEKPFGSLTVTTGGGARGHNGLRSLIAAMGPDFMRLRFGIGRPDQRELVPEYVLQPFTESSDEVARLIQEAVQKIENLIMRH